MRHIPNMLTCLNLLTGAVGIIAILTGSTVPPIYFVLIAAGFDFLDGLVARLLNVQSDMGKELDSLADMVSFGLFPSILLVSAIEKANPGIDHLQYVGLLVAAFSALRLAKFNIDTRQSDRFIGLPTPANAIMIASIPFLEILDPGVIFYIVVSIVTSLLLVSPITMIALKFKNLSWGDNVLRYTLIAISLLLFFAFGWSAIALLIPTYILLSVLGNFTMKNSV